MVVFIIFFCLSADYSLKNDDADDVFSDMVAGDGQFEEAPELVICRCIRLLILLLFRGNRKGLIGN